MTPNPKEHRKTTPPVDYTRVCDRVFSIAIHDIDIEILPDYDFSFETYFPVAKDLAQYIIESVSNGYDIICQCEWNTTMSL